MAVKNWGDLWWKLADNFASLKAEVLIFASWALAVGLLASTEWLIIAGAVIGGRVWTDIKGMTSKIENA